MKDRIEEILGTTKGKNETWKDVFNRINSERGFDPKTLVLILATILDHEESRSG